MQKDDCIFCLMAAGKAPFHEVWSDETHLAILSIFPNTDGFTVVFPKEHYDSYAFEQPDQVLKDLIVATKKTALRLDDYFDDVARSGMFFEGYGVDHLHSKLFPMHNTAPQGAWKVIESETNDTFYDKYPGFLSSNSSARADDQKLAALASAIRKKSE
jgi:diadenosine tetraphosphate (Ap4A) HIT family hydrolase